MSRHHIRLVLDCVIEIEDDADVDRNIETIQEVRNNLNDIPTLMMREALVTSDTDATLVAIVPTIEVVIT